MTEEEIRMQEITPAELAESSGLNQRTVLGWLQTGRLPGRQTFSGRWLTTVGAAREFLRAKGKDRGHAAMQFDAYVRRRFGGEEATC